LSLADAEFHELVDEISKRARHFVLCAYFDSPVEDDAGYEIFYDGVPVICMGMCTKAITVLSSDEPMDQLDDEDGYQMFPPSEN
jgi:hypothetical protein